MFGENENGKDEDREAKDVDELDDVVARWVQWRGKGWESFIFILGVIGLVRIFHFYGGSETGKEKRERE